MNFSAADPPRPAAQCGSRSRANKTVEEDGPQRAPAGIVASVIAPIVVPAPDGEGGIIDRQHRAEAVGEDAKETGERRGFGDAGLAHHRGDDLRRCQSA